MTSTASQQPTGPLRGIRVLEFSQIVAGPVAGIHLSDLGADVVKVEPLHGEDRRNTAAVVPNEGKYFQSLNRGKRSLTLDLRKPEARKVVHRIVPHFDVVLSNYRFGVAERLGIDYAALSKLHPTLIYASVTGFGDRGPFATRAGSDIVAQAYTGLMAAEGNTDEYGAPLPVRAAPVIDRASGFATAMGICAALFERERSGRGQELQVSLLKTGLELLSERVMREPVHDATARDPQLKMINEQRALGTPYKELIELRRGAARRVTSFRLWYGGYETAQGAMVLGALTRQNRDAVRRILGIHDTADDPDFDANDPNNGERIEGWRAEIQQLLLARTADEWIAIFNEAGVPASTVHLPEEMSEDPQVDAMGMMSELTHPITGPQRVVGPLVQMSVTPTAAQRSAPPLGADSRDVLEECGLTAAEVDELLASEVISQHD